MIQEAINLRYICIDRNRAKVKVHLTFNMNTFFFGSKRDFNKNRKLPSANNLFNENIEHSYYIANNAMFIVENLLFQRHLVINIPIWGVGVGENMFTRS